MSQFTAKVPVGFRFHPTDEELVGYYLPKKVGAMKIDLDLIRDLDLYKLEPWDLQELCKVGAEETASEAGKAVQADYYFFSRKDRKYPTGNRANRATTKGFWKATGRDKPIHTKLQTLIGMRKTLVFYQGRAPHGLKTDWIMHEFRLDDGPGRPAHEDGGWVVCRVFKKNKNLKTKLQERALSYEEQMGLLPEPHGSPDILSGRSNLNHSHSHSYSHGAKLLPNRFSFPESHHVSAIKPLAGVKREIINLDEYSSPLSTAFETAPAGFSFQQRDLLFPPPQQQQQQQQQQMRSYLARSLSLKRLEVDVHHFYAGAYDPGYDQSEGASSGLGELNDGTSGSDGAYENGDDSISQGLESVDWSALLQDEAPNPAAFNTTTTNTNTTNTNTTNTTTIATTTIANNPSTTTLLKSAASESVSVGGDVTVLLQMKRQNSDLFSSLDLWNYSQIAQQAASIV